MSGLIAHEWVEPRGGAERVVEQMCATFPDADLTVLWNDDPERFPQARETWLARTPLRRAKALALPLMPAVWRTTRVADADWVLASSHAFAHHVGGPHLPRKFVYAYTPARYIWAPEQDPRGRSAAVRAIAPLFRRLDRAMVNEGTSYATVSAYIARRVEALWGQPAAVIPPPVGIDRMLSAAPTSDAERVVADALPEVFVLGASRFIDYKRLDLVIDAGERAGVPVVIAGGGPLRDELRARGEAASVPVRVVERPSDGLMAELFRRAAVVVFPPVEDSGTVPMEAMAVGTPTVVQRAGGASEPVVRVGGGVVVDVADAASIARGIDEARRLDMTGVRERMREEYGVEAFRRRLRNWIASDGRTLD